MSKLPWTNYAGHGGSHDEGGMEHLETDVMRFMAILAFCLVAIFALVQSMPLEKPAEITAPETPPVQTVTQVAATIPPVVEKKTPPPDIRPPEPRTPPPRVVQRPAPQAPTPAPDVLVIPERTPPPPRKEPQQVALVMPERVPWRPPEAEQTPPAPAPETVLEPVVEETTPPPAPVATTPPETEKRGFSLRFDSDAALRQLVARDEVALYAIARKKAWRVMMVNERLSFRPAQTPSRFHEMAAETVPADVVKTLRRMVTVSADNLTWGVTLPAATSRQLSQFLSAYESGGLVIDADGALRLEQG